MLTQANTQTLISFHLWLDNYISNKGQGYITTTSQFIYQNDPALPNYVSYVAPFRSFVCDSGVSGATIMNSVSGAFGVLNRGDSGMMIDYQNGRILLPSSLGTNLNITGTYSFKEINIYKANETQEKLVFSNKYYLNPRFDNAPITGVPPLTWNPKINSYDMVTPCVFVGLSQTENKNWALGGLYNTNYNFELSIMAETYSQLEGTLSLLADSYQKWIPMLSPADWPLNFYGDFKNNSGYNYQNLSTQKGDPSNLYFVSSAKVSKVGDIAKIDQSVFVGVAQITLEKPRTLH